MAKWNEAEQVLTLNQDDEVHINVEGVGTFITVSSMRNDDNDDQFLRIEEWLNEEVIYENTIPAE